MLSHPSRKRRVLDGAHSIEAEPEVKDLVGPPGRDFIPTPAHRDETAMNGAQLLRTAFAVAAILMAGPPA